MGAQGRRERIAPACPATAVRAGASTGIHRISQTVDCEIVLLLAKDSIDEFVDFCLEQKTRLAEEALGEKVPQPLVNVLQHIILSHHEKPEFGAARVPAQ